MHLMLKRSWPGRFIRAARDAQGQVVETFAFEPGEPVEATPAMLSACRDDLGKALLAVELDDKSHPVEVDPGTVDKAVRQFERQTPPAKSAAKRTSPPAAKEEEGRG